MNLLNISQLYYNFQGTKIYPLTVGELIDIFKDENDLLLVLRMMVGSLKEVLQIKDENVSEFQTFLGLMVIDTDAFGLTVEKKEKFLNFIKACFKDYEMVINQEQFIFKKENEFVILDNTNFNEFKKILSQMYDVPELFKSQSTEYNPASARAARIAATLKKDNQKRAEINKTTNKKGIIENYVEILSIVLKIPPSTLCKELTLYTLFGLHRRFLMKTNWDLDIDCRLAGGSPKESPDNWLSLL